MEGKTSILLAVCASLIGISWISKSKSAFSSEQPGLNPGNLDLNTKKKSFDTINGKPVFIHKRAEIIGQYLNHGIGGTAFRLPQSGDVLKIVSLEQDGYGTGGAINREQADFMEYLWELSDEGRKPYLDDFVQLKHYSKGNAGQKLVELVESETSAHPLEIDEKIAYWVMEYIPTIGNGEMSKARILGAKDRVQEWAEKHGYKLEDLHEGNYGQREDGTFVVFDAWPTKLQTQER